MYRTNKISPQTLPCGISLRKSAHTENCPLTDTHCHNITWACMTDWSIIVIIQLFYQLIKYHLDL